MKSKEPTQKSPTVKNTARRKNDEHNERDLGTA